MADLEPSIQIWQILDPPCVTLTQGSYLYCPLGITLTGVLKIISSCGTDFYLNRFGFSILAAGSAKPNWAANGKGKMWGCSDHVPGRWEGGQGMQQIQASNVCWLCALQLGFRRGNLGYLCSPCLLQAVPCAFQGRNGSNAAQAESETSPYLRGKQEWKRQRNPHCQESVWV